VEERKGVSDQARSTKDLGGRRKSEPNLVALNDVDCDENDADLALRKRRARHDRRRSQSADRSDAFGSSEEQSVELTSRAAADNCKDGGFSSSRGREPRRSCRGSPSGTGDGGRERQQNRRSRSIDAINRVIKAVGVNSFELVKTDASDERPVMERKSSALLE
jgi:hypothetical protein